MRCARGRQPAPPLLLLLVALAAFSSPAAGQAPPARFSKPYNVCTSDWAPFVRCADLEDPAHFDGFQIDLWRRIAADLGWGADDWAFTCVDWTAMIEDLASPDGNCSFAAAGVEVSLPNIVAGLKFSWPIYKSGFQVLIASTVEEGSIWGFAEAFSWRVWVMLGATAIAVGLVITAAEMLAGGDRAGRKGLRGWSWYCMTKMVQITPHVGDPKTWAARVLVLGYAFLVLIIVHLFTATTASKLTMKRLANDISDKSDLPGKKVISWEPYIPLLRKYSIDATAMPWDSDEDTKAMLRGLRSHKHQALILDAPVVQTMAAQADECDLYYVGDPFETFNLAIAFPPTAPDSLAAAVSASIVRLQTTGAVLDELENRYIKAAGGACQKVVQSAAAGHTGSDNKITLQQVLGLWYILAMTLGGALIMTAAEAAARSGAVRRVLLLALTCQWREAAAAVRVARAQHAGRRDRSSQGSQDGADASQQQQQQQQQQHVMQGDGEVDVVLGFAGSKGSVAGGKLHTAGSAGLQQRHNHDGGAGGGGRASELMPAQQHEHEQQSHGGHMPPGGPCVLPGAAPPSSVEDTPADDSPR